MKSFLETVRKPETRRARSRQIRDTLIIMLFGFLLGVVQKHIDGDVNLPSFLQSLDIANYFGRFAVWILLATILSVYAETPLRAGINTSLFFLSMIAGYYLYCHCVLGFLPKQYVMVWVAISVAAFFLAQLCWYAKGQGPAAVILSGGILGVLLAQTFCITRGFYVYHLLEIPTWLIGVIILRRKPKEYAIELGLSIAVAFVYQLVMPHWG